MSTFLFLVGGITLLVFGAELLVSGAQRFAFRVGLSPVVVGLTVVAFGTSAPELVVSVRAGLSGSPDIAVGNVVGSNLFNVLIILGLTSVITPLVINPQLLRVDVPLLIGASLLCWLFALDGAVSQPEGALLCLAIVTYTAVLVGHSRRSQGSASTVSRIVTPEKHTARTWHMLILIGLGLGSLSFGAQLLIEGATTLARGLGVSELVVGLTIVAGGTSLPEVATSVVAAIRKQRDIAVGNIVGSNIFNLLAVLGTAAFITPEGLLVSRSAVQFDFVIMVLTSILCLLVFSSGLRVSRWEGATLLSYYMCYLIYLVLNARRDPATAAFAVSAGLFAVATSLGFALHMTVDLVRRRRIYSAKRAESLSTG